MALALFHKHLYKHRNIFERGIGKILIFLLIELPIELPIDSAWDHSAWGPRVLGRTGLAWGAKGPGPGRLGS